MLCGLDWVVAEAKRRRLLLLPCLLNYWDAYGGACMPLCTLHSHIQSTVTPCEASAHRARHTMTVYNPCLKVLLLVDDTVSNAV